MHCYNNIGMFDNALVNASAITDYGNSMLYMCHDVTVRNFTSVGTTHPSGYGSLYINYCNNTFITNSNFTRNDRGVYLTSTQTGGLFINNSVFDANTEYGIFTTGADNVTIISSTFFNHSGSSDYGIYLSGSDRWNITQSNFTRNYGGIIMATSDNSTIYANNFFNQTYYAVYLSPSANDLNVFHLNDFTNTTNAPQVYSNDANNYFNITTGGNWWSDWDGVNDGCTDTNGDGFCDAPYNMTPGTEKDYLPRTRAGPIAFNVLQIDPLDAWVVNDTIKFECNASTNSTLANATLWTNSSASQWLQNGSQITLSGTYAEFEFNRTGFSNGLTFVWGCRACTTGGFCTFSANRTLTIDLVNPQINFTLPTPVTNIRNTTYYNWLYANTSTYDTSNMSALLDYNRSLVGWYRFENNTNDSSTYANNGDCTAGSSCPETWTGPRGKSYRFDGVNDRVLAPNTPSIEQNVTWTISAWIQPGKTGSGTLQDFIAKYDWVVGQGGYLLRQDTTDRFVALTIDGQTVDTCGVTSTILTKGNWYFMAATFDTNTNTLTCYVNGAPEATNTGATKNPTAGTLGVYMGAGSGVSFPYNGSVDDVMIWNRVLSSDEINATYQNQAKALFRNFTGLPSGMVNYTASVVDVAGNYNTTGYRNYSVNWLPVVSGMTINSSSNTNYTNENISVLYTASDTDGDSVKNITNWYLNGTSIAVLNMPFESNTRLNMSNWTKDYVVGNHGIVYNGAVWNATGGYDGRGAYEFDGNDDYINTASSSFTNFTMTFWLKGKNVADNLYIAGRTSNMFLRTNFNCPPGYINYGIYNDSWVEACSGAILNDNRWYFLALRFNSTDVTLYINGTYDSNAAVSGTPPSSGNIELGTTPWALGTSSWNGTLDDVKVYNRTLTADQILLLYQNQTDKIHFNETSVGENWSACVTPNDGLEDGTQVCSANLTIRSAGITTIQVAPLDAWILNDTITFECNASSAVSLVNATVWTNSSNDVWAQNGTGVSISGTSAQFEFNRSGFSTDGLSLVWGCRACTSEECAFSANRTITIDLIRPQINFTLPTPVTNIRNTTYYNWLYVNTSTYDLHNMSAAIDYNRSVVGWWRFENNTLDSSTYGHTGAFVSSPKLTTGARGKALKFDGTDDYMYVTDPADGSLDLGTSNITISIWYKGGDLSDERFVQKYHWDTGIMHGYLFTYGVLYIGNGTAQTSNGYSATNPTGWNFYTAVIDRTNGVARIYVNAEQKQQWSFSVTGDIDTADAFAIAAGYTNPAYYSVDEVQMHKRALSTDEINASYQNQAKALFANFTGLPSGMVNYTASVVDMAGNYNTTGYRNYSVNWLPNVSNMVISSSSGTNYTNENISITYTTQDGDSDYVKNITTWYLNGTSVARLIMPFESNTQQNMSSWTKDYSGRNSHGTVTSAVWNSTGGYDGKGAYRFDGDNDYVDTTYDRNGPKFTFVAWYKPDAAPVSGIGCLLGASTGSQPWRVFFNVGGGASSVQIYNTTGQTSTYFTGPGIGNWQHLVVIYDNTTRNITIYTNGAYATSQIAPGGMIAGTGNSRIGVCEGTNWDFNGTIDDVRVYNITLSAAQVAVLYANKTDMIVEQETTTGENWSACVTPNDGLEDGTAVCSANLTIRSAGVVTTQVDPLDAWVVNDTIKFECNASSAVALTSAEVWTNSSGGQWLQNGSSATISGTYAEFEFNRTGFVNGTTFVWGCKACSGAECTFSANRTLTIDLVRPQINFTLPTPTTNIRNTTYYNWLYVNTSTYDTSNMSAMIDYNRSVIAWYRFENNTIDSSTYGNNMACGGPTCPETWTGPRGKSYRFGDSNYLVAPNSVSLNSTGNITVSVWVNEKNYAETSRYVVYKLNSGGYYMFTYANYPYFYVFNSTGGNCGAYQYTFLGTNTWRHLVGVYNGTHAALYVDGARWSLVACDAGFVFAPADLGLYVGNGNFNGSIDEVMILNRALSTDEINATYQNQAKALFRNFTGLAEGTLVNYTASVVDMAGNYNTTGYRNYSVNWLPNISAMSITSSSGTNYTNENISISYTTQDGDSDYVKNITTWYFNGTSIAVLNMPFESNTRLNMSTWTKDYAGSNHGTVSGATWNTTGGYDGRGAYRFNGTNIYVTIPDNPLLETMNRLSISVWFKPISTSDNKYVLYKELSYLIRPNSGNVFTRLYNSTGGTTTLTSTRTIGTDWNHVVVTYDGSTIRMYINGTQDPTTTAFTGAIQNGASLIIGGDTSAVFFNGSIDEVMIFNRTLSADQILLLYQNNTDKIHFNETTTGENWSACVTPNDGLEDGTAVCSVNLTIKTTPITTTQIDPLDAWVVNDTIKFECNASSAVALTSAELWTNSSGGQWLQNGSSATISGTYAEFEFNRTGFVNGTTFVWGCRACTAEECAFSANRTLTIDLVRPGIVFNGTTPATNARNTTYFNWLYANVTTTDTSNMSALLDYNRSLVGWWRLEENGTSFADSSSYGTTATCSGANCPQTWTGPRGKAIKSDGVNDYISADWADFTISSHTIEFWMKVDSIDSSYHDLVGTTLNSDNNRFHLTSGTNQIVWYNVLGTSTLSSGVVPEMGRWYHVVGVHNGTTATIYINGDYKASANYGTSMTSTGVWIAGSTEPFNGSIDEVRIWNRALSTDEINASYQNQAKALFRNFTGLAQGTFVNYTASVVDMAGNYNTTGYRNYSVNWLPNVSAMSITSSSGTNYTNENISISYTTQDGDSDYVKNITHWYLNGTSIAVLNMPFESNTQQNMSSWTKDYAGNNKHGTVSGAAWNSTGGIDGHGAYQFNGSGAWVSINNPSTINFSKSMTVSAWFILNDTTKSYHSIIGRADSINWAKGWGVCYVGGTMRFWINGYATNFAQKAFTNDAAWHHIATTYNGTTISIYIDGIRGTDGFYTGYVNDSAWWLEIGRNGHYIDPTQNLYWNGTIDGVTLYNRTLIADQILLLYQNNTDKIHFNETETGENWSACVTPNDGLEDGTQVCSVDLTVLQPTNCTVISTPGQHFLAGNGIGAPKPVSGITDIVQACVIINSDDVDFSCNGYNITNDDTTAAAGIIVTGYTEPRRDNITIRDCPYVTGYDQGVYYHMSDNNIARNITARGNKAGFYFLSSTESKVWNTSAYNNTDGYSVEMSTGTQINNSAAYNNTRAGFRIGKQAYATLTYTTAFANKYDLFANNSQGSAAGSITLNNMTFKRSTGSDVNSTTLLLTDALEEGTAYMINWTAAPQPLPAGTEAFNERFVEINSLAGAVSLGDIAWSWNDSETTGYDEDYFQLWKYSYGDWYSINTTPNPVTNRLSLANEYLASKYGVLENKSNNAPSIAGLFLNATDSPFNRTNANLTLWPGTITDPDSHPVKVYYNWHINGTSITVLNLPMSYKAEYGADEQTIYDLSGYGNNATSGNSTVGDSHEPLYDKNDGYDGFGAYIFDGADDYMKIANSASMYRINKTGTVSAWIRVTGCGGACDGIANVVDIRGSGVGGGMLLYQETDGKIYFLYGNGTALVQNLNSQAISTSIWYMITAAWNATTVKLYINDTVHGTSTNPPNINDVYANSYIGSHGSTIRFFNGTISDVMIYDRMLTPEQIASQYYSGVGRYNVTVKEETVKHQFWNATATPVDFRGKSGNTVWSNTVEIRNTPPGKPTLSFPNDGNDTLMTRTPDLNWTAVTDDDNDAITYKVNITDCNGLPIVYLGVAGTNRTVTQEMHTTDECVGLGWHNWTITANDTEEYGNASSKWGFKILPVIVLNLNPAMLDFGEKIVGQSDNSSDGSPAPFIVENNGTVVSDVVNVTADSNLWVRSPSPTDKFQIKVSDSEAGSINLTGSRTDWTDVSLSNLTLISGLNYSDVHDTARIDFKITVPGDEPPGQKSVQLTFYGVQAGQP
jgi:parallel beta-helix repeat protein